MTPIFLTIVSIMLAAGAVTTFLAFLTAHSLGKHCRLTYCLVIAALSCFYVPWGTAIGVCTIIVLNRPSVRALFAKESEQPAIGAS